MTPTLPSLLAQLVAVNTSCFRYLVPAHPESWIWLDTWMQGGGVKVGSLKKQSHARARVVSFAALSYFPSGRSFLIWRQKWCDDLDADLSNVTYFFKSWLHTIAMRCTLSNWKPVTRHFNLILNAGKFRKIFRKIWSEFCFRITSRGRHRLV